MKRRKIAFRVGQASKSTRVGQASLPAFSSALPHVDWATVGHVLRSPFVPADAKVLLLAVVGRSQERAAGIDPGELPGLTGLQPSVALPILNRLVECGALRFARQCRRRYFKDPLGAVLPGPALTDVGRNEVFFSQRALASDGPQSIIVNADHGAAERNRPAVDYCAGQRNAFCSDGSIGDDDD